MDAQHIVARDALALARRMVDGDPVAPRAALEALEPELIALVSGSDAAVVADAAEALAMLYEGRDHAAAERVLGRALALCAHEQRISLLVMRARARYLHGRFADASADAERALGLAREDDALRYRALLMASVTDRETGVLPRARARAMTVRAWAAASGAAIMETWALVHQASADAMLGELASAEATYREALARAQALGMRRAEGLAITNLGYCATRAGDPDRALVYFGRARALFEALGDAFMVNKLEMRVARASLDRGDLEIASARAAHAAAVAEQQDDRDIAVNTALIHARVQLERALATAREHGFVTVTKAIEGPAAQLRPLGARGAGASPLRVERSGYWFEAPRAGRVDLARRAPLRRVLAHLVARRLSEPDAAASTAELASAGWPSERILPEAAQDRVYTAVGTLRKMGLDGLLVRRDGGYALDPAVPVQVA